MFQRPDEWHGKFVLVWSDGTIEPTLFSTPGEGSAFWAANVKASAQTIPVVIRHERADDALRLRLKAWVAHARRNGLAAFEVNTNEIASLLGPEAEQEDGES